MSSRADAGPSAPASRARGFTLLEVMAAVLVLGLLFTWLAGLAMQGLRSEGIDRRRAEASLLIDRELVGIEGTIASGAELPIGRAESEAGPYVIVVEVAAEDLLGRLPEELLREEQERREGYGGASLLVDERGDSRVRRVSIAVQWDEAGEMHQVVRTTYAFDGSQLASIFPESGALEEALPQQEYDENGNPIESPIGVTGRGAGRGTGASGGSGGGRGPERSRPGDTASPRDDPSGRNRSINCDSLPPAMREFVAGLGKC